MVKTTSNWKPQDLSIKMDDGDIAHAPVLGDIEFEDPREDGEYIHFTIVATDTHLVFGGVCNTGFLESGNFIIDEDFSIDENLQSLIEDLESFYRDGDGYQSDSFAHNERM